MAKEGKLTVKQAKLVKGVVEGKTKRQAAIDAGYTGSPETVSVTASEVLKKPNVQSALHDALDKAGITPDLIVAPVVDALNHQDLDMRLKGHDRAAKIVQPQKQQGNGVTLVFGNQVNLKKYVNDED